MGFFYFDESVHTKCKFTLGAFAYSEDSLDGPIGDALRHGGLIPGVDEFKSGAYMKNNPGQVSARADLRSIVCNHCRIGVVIAHHAPRHLIGHEALHGLNKILATASFGSSSHEVFFDRGIFASAGAGQHEVETTCNGRICNFHFEQDSRRILGLQVADLIAHTCATMLLAQLGIVKKTVKAGPNSGYDPDSDMPLEFELWAGLRYNFFATGPPPVDTWKSQLDFKIDVESKGLHISNSCDESVKNAALSRFGSMYLGCIH
jgi:hypothetical protein